MADNIDFGDPIDFSPKQNNAPKTPPRFDMGRGPVRSQPVAAPVASSIPREPAHMVKEVAPLFPRPSITPRVQEGVGEAPQVPSQGVAPVGAIPQGPSSLPEQPKGGRKMLYVIIAVVLLLVFVAVGYFVISSMGNKSANNSTNNSTQTNQTSNTVTNTTKTPTNTTPTVNDPTGDPDGDALTNQEEATYGTDPNNPDSDGDTFKDGAEVEKGFNPLGAGKLPNSQP